MIPFFQDSWKTALRWAAAIGLVGLAVWISRHVGGISFVFCLPFLLVATLLVLKELTYPVTWMIDSFLGTTQGSPDKPPLDLRLARFYVEQDRLDEALAEYLRMMKLHPLIPEPYEQIMILLARTGASRTRIDQIRSRGLRKLRILDARNGLESAYQKAVDILAQRAATHPPINGDRAHPA
jgi:hypothetical protein